MSTATQRTIEFPSIDWEELKEGALSKDKVWDEIEKGVKFIVEIQMLKSTSFLSKDSIEKAREVEDKLGELKKQYPQTIGVVQNILGRKINEMARGDGDSKTLFSRLRVLVKEAEFHGSIQEWGEDRLQSAPMGLKRGFLIKIKDGNDGFRFFLPRNWRSKVHQRTALVLKDLAYKARKTWMDEHGIEPQKREVPAENKPIEKKPEKKKKTVKKPAKKVAKKVAKKTEADKNAAKAAKTVKTKARDKEDQKDMLEALKRD